MPYGISSSQDDCQDWATVKQETDGSYTTIGCHQSKQDAIDQMVAVSIAEGIDPLGEVRSIGRRAEGKILVVDVDGTLLKTGDRPIQSVIDAVNADTEYPLFILTGRTTAERDMTTKQLKDAGLRRWERMITKEDESIETPTYKKMAIQGLMNEGYEIDAFVDNDAANRAAVAELGVDVYSPAEYVADAKEPEEMDEESSIRSMPKEKRNDELMAFIAVAISVLQQAQKAYEQEEMDEPEEEPIEEESRAVDLKAPAFMRASARRGLALHEQGYSGEGLLPQTVEDARKMAAGDVSEAKWRKIGAWIARHMDDLDAVQGDEITPGLVAMLLWGGGSSKASARRAMEYAYRIVERLDDESERAVPKKDQIFGSDKNPEGSAKGKEGGIDLGEATETALQNKADEHNKKMDEANKPNWTRVRVGALRSVWRRGAGAFSTSHRPGMTRAQWAMARVNAFLYLSANGRPENENYVTDNDLLHPDHPKYSGD